MVTNIAFGDEALQRVKVADPFLDLRTGPGDGYPIFHVIERGDYLDVILRRTSWLKVKTEKGLQGWVSSIGVHRACGFEHVGTMTAVGRKFDRWIDVVIMQRALAT